MKIHELQVGGQKSIWGNIYYILVKEDTIVNNLTCPLGDMQTISVKLKCKTHYKMVHFTENISQLFSKHCSIC